MIGETLGSYRILRQLGAGAMGEVYLAEHRHLKRKAALKLLARELMGRPDLLERFFFEARATSAIAHPGIVQIFDCEIDGSGRPYIVMEYLSGETLAARLSRSQPLPTVLAARYLQAMAAALEAAHAKGIVHRDLKPENIFVEAGPPESVKLVDFGIAKLAGDFQGEQVHRTRVGALMGTPLYMSPEQCRDSASIDFRTDLYSLGCVAFEMLTGRPPFTHHALGDLVVAHLTEKPVDVRTLNPSVQPPLAELCAALLQKDPAARPANMAEIAERLGSFIARATTVPSGPPVTAEAAPPSADPVVDPRVKTTFGESTGEIVVSAQEEADVESDAREGLPRRRRVVLVAGVGVALIVGGTVAIRASMSSAPPQSRAKVAAEVVGAMGATSPSGGAGAISKDVSARPDSPGQAASRSQRPDSARARVSRKAVAEKGTATTGGSDRDNSKAPESRAIPASRAGSRAKVDDELGSQRGVGAPSTPPLAATAVPSRSEGSLIGAWEGPWNDPGKQQNGRLYLHIAADGTASGWMFNAAAGQSFRMAGRLSGNSTVDLACQCPPDRKFSAHGTISFKPDGVLSGSLALSSSAGTFGHSHVMLRRTTVR